MSKEKTIVITTQITASGVIDSALVNHLALHAKRDINDIIAHGEATPNHPGSEVTYDSTKLRLVGVGGTIESDSGAVDPVNFSNPKGGITVWYSDSCAILEGVESGVRHIAGSALEVQGIFKSDDLQYRFMLVGFESDNHHGDRINYTV
ncbi:MAG: hypothetical protein RPS47_04480 [Colwellia sp.]|jgi:hypothetical protein